MESLLCRSAHHQERCKCAFIKDIYGSKPFKCPRFGCPTFRNGFESAEDRDLHLKTHDRPYRCDWPACDFGHIGFASQTRLNAHLKLHKGNDTAFQTSKDTHVDRIYMERILLDAIKADDIDVIRASASEVPNFAETLLEEAVETTSPETLLLLLEICSGHVVLQNSPVLKRAIDIDNLDAVRLLLDRGFHYYALDWFANDKYLTGAILNRSPDMLKLLFQYYPEHVRNINYYVPSSRFLPLDPSPELEARVVKCLGLLKTWTVNPRIYFTECFTNNSVGTLSIAVAKYLLKNGVSINAPDLTQSPSATALYLASAKTSLRAAELMKFLLESGASPEAKPNGETGSLSQRPGPANISQWFGLSWDQLVEESQKVYALSRPTGKKKNSGPRENLLID